MTTIPTTTTMTMMTMMIDDSDDDDDDDDGTGNGSDDDSDDDSDDGSELTDRQIIKFMFREGLKLGINVFEFVDVEFLKVEFQAELSKHYSIEIAAVGELDQFLVVDYLYGGFVSEEIDYQFYRQAYATQLEAAFSVEVETLTDLQILEHAYTVGLTEGLALSPIDYEGCLKDFGQEIADYFKLDLKEIGNLDRTQVKFFILEVASEFNLDISQYVDLEYFRRESGNSVIENYRVEQVYSLDYEQTFEFVSAQVGVNTSPLIDLEWYRTEYPEDLAANQAELDADGNGEIDDSELYDALTGEFLEQGNETSPLYNFEEYFNSDEIKGDVATYYNVESFDQLTHAQKLAYMFGQGLLEGNDPFSEEFLAEHPELEFETFLQVNSAALVQFSGVQSIEEVSFTEVYDYQAVNGLLNPGSDAMI
ncbi:MAG: hypothetical protein HC835_20095 [Oscillatoriales cyanobacterium RM2_1_1]|nr:hypothetical protein [Oscillatoriales cyanobacterium RM2_1_1]